MIKHINENSCPTTLIMINILLMYMYGIFQTVHQGKATLNNLTCKWNFQLFTYFKKECFIGAI
jgi:hypothetical protein